MEKPDWFIAWADHHYELFPRSDWPAFESEFWNELFLMFQEMYVNPEVAHRASRALFRNPPAFVGDHPKALRDKIQQIFRDAESTPPPPINSHTNASFDQRAEANWARLSEEERETWRQMARDRLPALTARTGFLEGIAKGWACDPKLVVGMPPTGIKPQKKHGPQLAFIDTPNPKGSAA